MPVLQTTDIPDLIEATLEDLGRMRLTDLSSDLQEYIAFNRLMRASQIDKQSGSRIRVNLLTDTNPTARFKGYYATDGTANQNNALTHGFVDWRAADFYWAWDEMEVDVNAGQEQIQDYVRVKRNMATIGWADFIENWWWGVPPAVGDNLTALPLRYWINKDVTTAGADGIAGSGSFSGNVPSGYSDVAGIVPANFPRWKNYTFKWIDITEDDLLVKWRRMARKINFTPPNGVSYPSYVDPTMQKFEHFVPESVIAGFERLTEKRNDNLGYDFAAHVPTFARGPITWAPKLDLDTDNPIYSMNWNAFKTVILRGKWMRERRPENAAFQHTVWVVWTDSRWQTVLYDRRRCSVGCNTAANP